MENETETAFRRLNVSVVHIRPTKLGARNWMFIGAEAAGQKSAILYTIVENCRRLGINPKQYLVDVLTRLPAISGVLAWPSSV